MTASGTSAALLPAAVDSAAAAPSSSPSSPQQLGRERRTVATSLEVDWDWEDPVTPGHKKRTMDDVMRRSRVVDAPLPVARAPEYTYYATLLCETCGSGDREEDMLVCDGCNRGHHTFCLRPIAVQVPVGPWFCPVCAPPAVEEHDSFPAVNQTEISNSFEIEKDELQDASQAAESRVCQGFHPHLERENEIDTTLHHKMTAPGTSAPLLPAATPAPSSSPSSPQLRSKSKVVTSLEVKLDWEHHPVTSRPKRSMDDIMYHARVIDAPPPVARAAEYTYYATLLCETCGSGDREQELLLCDGCNRGHHTFCLRPIAAQVLVGPWFCPVCAPPATVPNSLPLNQTKISNSFEIKKDEQLADQATESRVSQGFLPDQIKISTLFGIDQKDEQHANHAAESRFSQGFPLNQTTMSNSFEIQKDEQADADQTAECRVSQGFRLNHAKISNSFEIQKDEQDADDQAADSMVSQGFPLNQQTKISNSFENQNHKQKDADQAVESRVSQVGPTNKNLMADDDSIELWNNFMAKRAFRKQYKIEGQSQSPPFIEISDFYITYDEFYDSFKARGLVGNNVMTLWCNQFNLDQLQLFEEGKTTYRKFAFSQIITGYMTVIPDSFNHEKTCKKIYTKINETFPFIKMDLVFFPIVFENHWVLLCVSMSMKQIAFFDSLSASKGTKSLNRLNHAENLILNFAATTMKYGFLQDDVSDFEWTFPLGYPKQKNLVDCGMYTMDYMDAWNGMEMVASSLEKGIVLEYRKHAALLLLESVHNKIKLDDFVKRYNGKET